VFQALLCASPGAPDYNVFFHIGRAVLGLLYVGGKVQLGWISDRVAGKIEGRVEEKGRRRKRCKQLLDGLKEKGGYWKMKEETIDRTVWKIR